MGVYISGAEGPGFSSNIGPSGCREYTGGGAFVYDAIGNGCWAVISKPVMITPTYHSLQGGTERINWSFRRDGTQSPVPTNLALAKIGEFA